MTAGSRLLVPIRSRWRQGRRDSRRATPGSGAAARRRLAQRAAVEAHPGTTDSNGVTPAARTARTTGSKPGSITGTIPFVPATAARPWNRYPCRKPARHQSRRPSHKRPSPRSSPRPAGKHTVEPGDTLYGIADRYGLSAGRAAGAEPAADPGIDHSARRRAHGGRSDRGRACGRPARARGDAHGGAGRHSLRHCGPLWALGGRAAGAEPRSSRWSRSFGPATCSWWPKRPWKSPHPRFPSLLPRLNLERRRRNPNRSVRRRCENRRRRHRSRQPPPCRRATSRQAGLAAPWWAGVVAAGVVLGGRGRRRMAAHSAEGPFGMVSKPPVVRSSDEKIIYRARDQAIVRIV